MKIKVELVGKKLKVLDDGIAEKIERDPTLAYGDIYEIDVTDIIKKIERSACERIKRKLLAGLEEEIDSRLKYSDLSYKMEEIIDERLNRIDESIEGKIKYFFREISE